MSLCMKNVHQQCWVHVNPVKIQVSNFKSTVLCAPWEFSSETGTVGKPCVSSFVFCTRFRPLFTFSSPFFAKCVKKFLKTTNLGKLDFVETRATQSASDGWAPGDGYMAYVHHPPRLCQEVHLSPACAKISRETNKFSLCQADALKNNLELIHLP